MSEPPSPTRPADLGVTVTVEDLQSDHVIDSGRWALLAEHALAARGLTAGELSLTFVDEPTIAELNAEHMGVEGPTDVLSFPLDADADPDEMVVGEMPLLLGDIVICPAVAAQTAPRRLGPEPHPGFVGHQGTLEHELALLVVHGVLHVLGMDHAEPAEAALMHQAEESILGSSPLGLGAAPTEPTSLSLRQPAPDKERS